VTEEHDSLKQWSDWSPLTAGGETWKANMEKTGGGSGRQCRGK